MLEGAAGQGLEATALRFGWFHGPESAQTRQMAKALIGGEVTIVGRGLLVGGDVVRFLTAPFPTSNERFKQATGWAPGYATHAAGLDAVVAAWRREGRLQRAGDGLRWAARPGGAEGGGAPA